MSMAFHKILLIFLLNYATSTSILPPQQPEQQQQPKQQHEQQQSANETATPNNTTIQASPTTTTNSISPANNPPGAAVPVSTNPATAPNYGQTDPALGGTQQIEVEQLKANANNINMPAQIAPIPDLNYTPLNALPPVNNVENSPNNILSQAMTQAQLPTTNNPSAAAIPPISPVGSNSNPPPMYPNYIPANGGEAIDALNPISSSKGTTDALNNLPQHVDSLQNANGILLPSANVDPSLAPHVAANFNYETTVPNLATPNLQVENVQPNQVQFPSSLAQNLPHQVQIANPPPLQRITNNNIPVVPGSNNNVYTLQTRSENTFAANQNPTAVLQYERGVGYANNNNNNIRPTSHNYGVIPNDIVYLNENNFNNNNARALLNATQAPNFNETEREMWKRDSTMPYICGSPPYRFYAKHPCPYYAVCVNGGFKVNVPCAQTKECLELNPDTECVEHVCCTLPVVIGILPGNATTILPQPGASPPMPPLNPSQIPPTAVIYPPQNEPKKASSTAAKSHQVGNLSITVVSLLLALFHVKSLLTIH